MISNEQSKFNLGSTRFGTCKTDVILDSLHFSFAVVDFFLIMIFNCLEFKRFSSFETHMSLSNTLNIKINKKVQAILSISKLIEKFKVIAGRRHSWGSIQVRCTCEYTLFTYNL